MLGKEMQSRGGTNATWAQRRRVVLQPGGGGEGDVKGALRSLPLGL